MDRYAMNLEGQVERLTLIFKVVFAAALLVVAVATTATFWALVTGGLASAKALLATQIVAAAVAAVAALAHGWAMGDEE